MGEPFSKAHAAPPGAKPTAERSAGRDPAATTSATPAGSAQEPEAASAKGREHKGERKGPASWADVLKEEFTGLPRPLRLVVALAVGLGTLLWSVWSSLPDEAKKIVGARLLSWSGAEPTPAAPEAALEGGAPEGMALVPAATFFMGETPAQAHAAFQQCVAALGGTACAGSKGLFFRAVATAGQRQVAAFYIDQYEATCEAFARWLTVLQHGVQLQAPPSGGPGVHDVMLVGSDHAPERIARLGDAAAFGTSCLERRGGVFVAAEGASRLPVDSVTWHGAAAYCRAHGKRLPTEQEWELAARGSSGRLLPWGDPVLSCDEATFGRAEGGPCNTFPEGPTKVGSAGGDRAKNSDIFDLGGNVAEWVSSRYEPPLGAGQPGPAGQRCAPEGGDGVICRVTRGGSWLEPALFMRSTLRSRAPQTAVRRGVGFRCAKDAS